MSRESFCRLLDRSRWNFGPGFLRQMFQCLYSTLQLRASLFLQGLLRQSTKLANTKTVLTLLWSVGILFQIIRKLVWQSAKTLNPVEALSARFRNAPFSRRDLILQTRFVGYLLVGCWLLCHSSKKDFAVVHVTGPDYHWSWLLIATRRKVIVNLISFFSFFWWEH